MNKEDIIECSSFNNLENVRVVGNYKGTSYWDEPDDRRVIWCSTDDVSEFFRRFGRVDKQWVLISSCSDFGPALSAEMGWSWDAKRLIDYVAWKYPDVNNQYNIIPRSFLTDKVDPSHKYYVRSMRGTYYSFNEIPPNIVHWYCTNPFFSGTRITQLPFGIPEGNRDALWKVMNEGISKENYIYANFGMTNPIDREPLWEQVQCGELKGRSVKVSRGLSKEDYYRELAGASWNLTPYGNGADSYARSESIYLGTKILVSADEFIPTYVYGLDNYDYYDFFDWIDEGYPCQVPDTLKLSYWREKFFSHFN